MTLFEKDPDADIVKPWRPDQPAQAREGTTDFSDWLIQRERPPGSSHTDHAEVVEAPPAAGEAALEDRIEEARREAREEARAQSQQALEDAEKSHRAQLEALQQRVLTRVDALSKAVAARVHPTSVALAEAMARAILRAELELHPERILPAVADLLDHATGLGDVEIRVHPDAARAVEDHLDELQRPPASGLQVHRVVADPDLALGDIRVMGTAGSVDALLTDRLDQLAELARSELEFVPVDLDLPEPTDGDPDPAPRDRLATAEQEVT